MILCDAVMNHYDVIQRRSDGIQKNHDNVRKSLFIKVIQLAEKEERSFNKQVIALLKKAIGDQIAGAGKGGEK